MMDSSQNKLNKKQRNTRNPKEKKGGPVRETGVELPNSKAAGNKVEFDPQPQRANRRQNNESTVNKGPAQVDSDTSHGKKETVENVTIVDHSKLKRETEEITKLNQKFTKREVTSNWHRYLAPEGDVGVRQPEEEAPADFSDLLRVPVSRGGHLQLKEEQAWSTVSGTELSGYFALDLNLLSLGLSCVPLYDQLGLSKDSFTDEEVKHFDGVAEQAKKLYSPDNVEADSNKILTNIVHKGLESNTETTTRLLNILGVDRSKEHPNDTVQPEKTSVRQEINSLDCIENGHFNLVQRIEILSAIENVHEGNKIEIPKPTLDITRSTNDLTKTTDSLLNSNLPNLLAKENIEKQVLLGVCEANTPLNKTLHSLNSFDKTLPCQHVFLNDNAVLETQTKEKMGVNTSISENVILLNNIKEENITPSEAKEKRIKRKENRKSPLKENNTTKLTDRANFVISKDDDDDNLDFLLSLKNPVSLKMEEDSEPSSIKDSSFLPGLTVSTQPSAQQQQSELDDWLDSVLED